MPDEHRQLTRTIYRYCTYIIASGTLREPTASPVRIKRNTGSFDIIPGKLFRKIKSRFYGRLGMKGAECEYLLFNVRKSEKV